MATDTLSLKCNLLTIRKGLDNESTPLLQQLFTDKNTDLNEWLKITEYWNYLNEKEITLIYNSIYGVDFYRNLTDFESVKYSSSTGKFKVDYTAFFITGTINPSELIETDKRLYYLISKENLIKAVNHNILTMMPKLEIRLKLSNGLDFTELEISPVPVEEPTPKKDNTTNSVIRLGIHDKDLINLYREYCNPRPVSSVSEDIKLEVLDFLRLVSVGNDIQLLTNILNNFEDIKITVNNDTDSYHKLNNNWLSIIKDTSNNSYTVTYHPQDIICIIKDLLKSNLTVEINTIG